MPTRQAGEVIGPHQKHKIVGGMALPQGVERSNGVAGARQAELNILGAEAGVAGQGQLYQTQSLSIGQQVGYNFKGALGRHNEPDFGQVGAGSEVLGQNEVAGMHGVERAKKQAYPNAVHTMAGSALMNWRTRCSA